MRKSTFRRVPARATLGLALAMSLFPCGLGPRARAEPATVAPSAPAQRPAPAPHPLAAAYPGHSVVVCEAGCLRGRGPEIVYFGRRNEGQVVERSELVPTSSRAEPRNARSAASATIDCLGGCYDTPRRYRARVTAVPAHTATEHAPAAAIGPWITTVTSEGGTPAPLGTPQR
jgi:hypothetical protein